MSQKVKAPIVTGVIVPGKRDKKGARFINFFGADPSPALIRNRVDKVGVELDKLATVAQGVEGNGGDPTEFAIAHQRLKQRLTDISQSTDTPKIKFAQLANLKDSARLEVQAAVLRGPDLIDEGRIEKEKTEKSNEKLRQTVAGKKKTVTENMVAIQKLLDQTPGELTYFSNLYGVKQREVLVADSETDLKAASGLWHMLFIGTSGMLGNIPVAAACIEPEKSALFWLDKVDKVVVALPKDETLDEDGVLKAQALRTANTDLLDKKDRADNGKLSNRRDLLIDICNEASRLCEPMRKSEIAATLPGTDKPAERDKKLDELATSLTGKEDLDSQTTMRAAIALRFGIEFATSDEFNNPLGAGIKKLGSLYDVLKMVPAAHLKAKEGTMQLTYKESLPGSEDEGRPNKFAKRDVPNDTSGAKVSTIVLTLPTDGEKIKKKNAKDEQTELEYFASTALHEIGHAVDDKEGYMAAHRASAGYGQWAPSDRNQVKEKWAAALGTRFDGDHKADLETFVDACLDGKTPKQPTVGTEPFIALVAKWPMLEGAGGVIRGLRETGSLWYKGKAKTQSATLPDGRVYFEAYSDQWWSFLMTERGDSVAEYQWRAPGEWFAEAYSLFYLGKLPAEHPVAKWCETQKTT